MRILWEEHAWEEYCEWQLRDKKILKRINALIKDIQRNSYEGIGKPEPLKGNLNGWWSRRIDDVNRIVYCEKDDATTALCGKPGKAFFVNRHHSQHEHKHLKTLHKYVSFVEYKGKERVEQFGKD